MVFVHKQLTLFSLLDGSKHRKIQKTMAEKANRRFKGVPSFIPSASIYPVNWCPEPAPCPSSNLL